MTTSNRLIYLWLFSLANLRHVSLLLAFSFSCVWCVGVCCVSLSVCWCWFWCLCYLCLCNKLWKKISFASNMDRERDKQTNKQTKMKTKTGYLWDLCFTICKNSCNNSLLKRHTTVPQKRIIEILRIRGVDMRAKTAAMSSNDKSNVKVL